MFKNLSIIAFVIVLIIGVLLGPWAVVWAVNEIGQFLWPQRVVPYTFWTWLAVLIIGVFIRSDVKVTKK
jgi:hypothetical protein